MSTLKAPEINISFKEKRRKSHYKRIPRNCTFSSKRYNRSAT